jgi:hypothetical protein
VTVIPLPPIMLGGLGELVARTDRGNLALQSTPDLNHSPPRVGRLSGLAAREGGYIGAGQRDTAYSPVAAFNLLNDAPGDITRVLAFDRDMARTLTNKVRNEIKSRINGTIAGCRT